MTDVIAPLTPADCDLRDFGFMPLDVVRLRDSDIALKTTGEEFRSAVLLWCAAWHQVPAGSLPNDDLSLASLAGFGRALGEWMKVREGALRGWVQCTDGRLYHPVVCEKANSSWAEKLRHAHRKLLDRLRKAKRTDLPTYDQWIAAGKPSEWPDPSTDTQTSDGSAGSSKGNEPDIRRKSADLPTEGISRDSDGPSRNADFPASTPQENGEVCDSNGNSGTSSGSAGSFQGKDEDFPSEFALKGEVREREGNIEEINTLSGRPDNRQIARKVLSYLNERTGRAYRAVDTNLDLIVARLKSGATMDDCKAVIDAKVADWANNPDMEKYLRPETLFGARKFEQYLGSLSARPLISPVEQAAAVEGDNFTPGVGRWH